MEVAVVLAFASIMVAVGAGARLARQRRRRRISDFLAAVRTRGWELTAHDDSLAHRWHGRPFRGAGHARKVVRGHYRGRDFTAFEYSYATKPTPNADTAIPHRFAVWALPLPVAVPSLSVGGHGALGATVPKAFGTEDIEIADEEFDHQFKVTGEDEAFVARVLQPSLVEHLKSTGPWEWRFEGDTMLAFEPGRLEAENIAAKLDAMIGVLDRVSADVWRLA